MSLLPPFKYKGQYTLALEKWNPITTVIVCKNVDHFKRFCICLAMCKAGFKHCRPIVCVDGCQLKDQYGGQLLCAIEIDRNNNMFPIADTVVEAETWDSWTWFMRLLLEDIGLAIDHGWTFTSNGQKVCNNSMYYLRTLILTSQF